MLHAAIPQIDPHVAAKLLGNIIAGVAADRVFVPWVGRDRVSSPTLAAIIGNGPDRGIAMLLIFVGLLTAVCTALAAFTRPLLRLDDELPDAAPDDEAEAGAARDTEPDAVPAQTSASGQYTTTANEPSH